MKFDLFTMCTTLRHNSHTYGPAVFKLGGSVIHKKHYILRKVKRRLHIAIGLFTYLATPTCVITQCLRRRICSLQMEEVNTF